MMYCGDAFNVDRVADDWTIYRFSGGDEDREQIILTTEAMDELRDYFTLYYAEDRTAGRF